MARKAAVKEATADDERLKIIDALKFAAIATKEASGPEEFVTIRDKWLMAENETFTLGIPVNVSLELCPHAALLQAALQQCGQHFQLVQLDSQTLSITSGNFRAMVPGMNEAGKQPMPPDPPCAAITDKLTDSFKACLQFMSKGERIINTSVLLNAMTTAATNGAMALEYWHGIDLPGPLNIPKKTAETLVKITKPLAKFGFSATSATFFFDDGSFLKTRLIAGAWPKLGPLFDKINGQFMPIWPEFYVALKAISAFIQNDTVFFHGNYLATHTSLELGANYRVNGLPHGFAFSAAYLRSFEPHVKKVCMPRTPSEPVALIGDNSRGLLVGKRV